MNWRAAKGPRVWCVVAVLSLISTAPLPGQESKPAGLEFQRIAIPKGRIDEAGGELLPIDRDKFQTTVAELNAKYRALYGLNKPNIVRARYSATFEGGYFVNGTAELEVKHPYTEPAYLTLTQLGIAADSFLWKSDANGAAVAGLLPTGDIGVLVTQSDTLTFAWSARGTAVAGGEYRFPLSFPEATASELMLDLPPGLKPECVAGLASQSAVPSTSATSGAPGSRWRIELGAAHQTELCVVPILDESAASRLVMVRPTYDYRIATTGLELRATFQIDVQRHARRELTLQLDPSLRVAAIQSAGQPVPFATGGEEATPPDRLVLELPTPIVGGPHEVTVTAYAPAVVHQAWTLPQLRLVDVLWRQGEATLEVTEPLRIGQLNWSGSMLRDATPLPAPAEGESRSFDLLSPTATCEVLLTRQMPQLQARTGTTITLNDSIVASQFVAQLTASGGAVFAIPLQRDAGWIVDSIETDPPQIDRVEDVPGTRGLSREVYLRRPITPSTPLKLLVKAHRRMPVAGALTGLEMRPIALPGKVSQSRLTAVRAELPLRLDVAGDAWLSRVTDLSPTDKELVAADDLVFRDGPSADRLRVLLRSEPPRFNGAIAAEAIVDSSTIRQSFLFRCEPVSTRVAAFRVRFTPTPRDNVQWSLVGGSPGGLTATRLAQREGEWDVRLREPRNEPFEVRALLTQSSSDSGAEPPERAETIVLASLPDAESQVGTINIGTTDGSGFSLQHEGLKAIPTQPSDPTRLPTLRATYRYAPAQDVVLHVVRHAATSDPPDAWIWDAEATSRVDAGGDITHLLLLRIENVGAARFTAELPEGVTLEDVDVDGQRMNMSQSETKLRIPLPAAQRFPIVRLRYRQQTAPLGSRSRFHVILPRFDLRCLKRSWRMWIPPGYEARPGNETWWSASADAESAVDAGWEQRLVGFALLRRTGQPWNLASLPDWSDGPARPSHRQQALTRMRNFLDAFDAKVRSSDIDIATEFGWRDCLLSSQSATARSGASLPLYVDLVALDAAGIAPTAGLPEDAASAMDALLLSGLVLVGNEQGVVVTTLAAQAAGEYGACTLVGDRLFLTRSNVWEQPDRLVPIANWFDAASAVPRRWFEANGADSLEPIVGWTNIRLPATDSSAVIILYRSAMVTTCAWAAMFVAVACGIALGRRSRGALFASVIAAIIIALLVPATLVFLTRSVLLGLLAAVALLSLRRRAVWRTPARRSDESFSFRLARRAETVTSALLLAAVGTAMVSTQRAVGQDKPASAPRATTNVFRVYDPVDSDGQPTGPRIYVSRTFFESLEALKMTLGSRQLGVILKSARYSLAIPDVPNMTMLPALRAEFELLSLRNGITSIQLPLDRDQLQILDATLDEQRVYPRWSQDGRTLEIDAETVDRHSLVIMFRPVVASGASGTGFGLRIPTIPDSRLSIAGEDTEGIDVSSALGAITRTENTVEAELGPTDRLAVHWPTAGALPAAPAEFTTSQLLWVRAEPRVIAIDTQFTISMVRGSLPEIELLVDPRLQLLVTENQGLVTEQPAPDDGEPRKIRFQFNRAYEANETVTIKPSFVITDFSSQGVLKGPLIKLVSGTGDGPLLAVSASPALRASVVHAGDWPSIDPQAFADAWGTSQRPKSVLQLPTSEADWSLAVAALVPQLHNVEATELRIRRQHTDVVHEAQLEISESPVLQLVFQVPPDMNVDSVAVLQDGVDVARRHWKSADGTTTVFLTNPILGDVQVALTGSLAVPAKGRWSFAGIRLPAAHTSERTLAVFRSPDVLVTAPPSGNAHPVESWPANHRWGKADRVVAVYDLASSGETPTADVTLSVAPNSVRLAGRIVTTLESDDAEWSVNADLQLRVSQGVADTVRIRLPRELTDSLELDPPLPYQVQEVVGQSEQNLIITPPNAIEKELHVTLQAQLQTSPDGSISAPAIEVLDTAEVERFLVLPKRSGAQEIEWDIRGLEQPESDESQTTYRIRGQRMQAVVREVNQSAGNPQVLLADIQVAWQPDASYIGVVSFDLEPGELTTCDLELPPAVELLHATVDDVPALLQHVTPTQATLELGAERLPQRIAVLFTGRAVSSAAADRSMTLFAPSLRGLEPLQTVWELHDCMGQSASRPLLNHTRVTRDDVRRLRASVVERILHHDIGPVPQHRIYDLQRWRTRWQQRLADTLAAPSDASRSPSVISLGNGLNWQQLASGHGDASYCAMEGSAPALTIIRQAPEFTGLASRVAMALGVLVAGWWAWKLARNERIRDAFSRWPQLPGVVVGLVWWLWFWPSVVGWFIVAIFLVSALRPSWRWRKVHTIR